MADVLVDPGMNFTPPFSRAQSQQENRLKCEMFERGLPKGLEGRFSEFVEDQGQIPRRNISSTLGFIPMETVQQPSQILILADIYWVIADLVGYGSSIAINSARLEVLLPKKGKEGSPQSVL